VEGVDQKEVVVVVEISTEVVLQEEEYDLFWLGRLDVT